MQEVLQWNIARDGPMEYCVQQIATDKGELGIYCHLRNQQQGMVCDNGVLHGVQNWATVIIGRSQQQGMVCDNGVLRGMPVLRVTTPEPTQR